MNATEPSIAVIVCTLAEARRRNAIFRALQSIRSQRCVNVIPIIVANGNRFDPSLLAELKARSDLRFSYIEQGSLPAAMQHGRAMVDTPFFCFLDDDDEYLPDGLHGRVVPMLANEEVDGVVGSGYRFDARTRSSSGWKGGPATSDEALRMLLTDNWLTSCSGLYRSGRVDTHFFADIPPYVEWTYLAYKLCTTRKIEFVSLPGHLIHDSEASASKSRTYQTAQAAGLRQVLHLPMPSEIRMRLREKYGSALHVIADHYRRDGRFGTAWGFHLKSLMQPGGLRYLPYTRKLFPTWVNRTPT